jgi:hypothetical protein
LVAQLLLQATASGFIGVDMALNRFMANIDLIGNLDGTPLLEEAIHCPIALISIILAALREPKERSSVNKQACLGR